MRLISVAGATSRAGKTALAVSLLESLGARRAAAVKFTTTEDVFERCPRGTACIVCDIQVPYRLVDEETVLRQPGTDTDRLARAGARQVVWAIARASALESAWTAVRRRIAGDALVVMEGSSVVKLARPDLLLFVAHPHLLPERWKPTTRSLVERADAVIVNRPVRERRAPSPSVVAALTRFRGGEAPIVADVTRPLAEWAPRLAEALPERRLAIPAR